MTFSPNEHMIQIKSKNGAAAYLPVQWRLVWFRELCPDGTIETQMVHLDLERETEEELYTWNSETRRSEKTVKHANGFVVFRASINDGKGGSATATKSEKAASFPDYIEKAETGAVGRALAMLGYGTQFTGDELDEEHRIVDAPVERKPGPGTSNGNGNGHTVAEGLDSAAPSQQQLASMEKLAEKLGREVETPKTYGEAKALLVAMAAEYNDRKAKPRK